MSSAIIQKKIDELSAAVARGDLIDADLHVTSKTSWKWRLIKLFNCLLQPFYSCFGKDPFLHYRTNNVAQSLLKLCGQCADLSFDTKTKAVGSILTRLNAKTRGRYAADVEKVKALVLGGSPVIAQRKTLVQNALNRIAYDLHQKLSGNSQKNVCFSPIGLAPILGMILGGMPKERRESFLETLGLQNLGTSLVLLTISELMADVSEANGDLCSIQISNAFVAHPDAKINPKYKEFAKVCYGAEEFLSEGLGQVKNLVLAQDLKGPSPSFVMLNGIHFSGKWIAPFRDAVDEQFTFANGGSQKVKMMPLEGNLPVYDGDTFRMIEIPYRSPHGHRLIHTVFLPNEGQPLNLLEARLTPEFIAHCRREARNGLYDVRMPKLNVDVRDATLLDTLQRIGLPMSGALPEISEQAQLKKIIHQAKVQVDEKGTFAVAATEALAVGRSVEAPQPVENKKFLINRSYVYMISDNNQILFQGNVRDPAALVSC